MFCIIPFVDYTPDAGPCAAVPGSYHKTTILPSDGRVHQVDAGQVPVRGTLLLSLFLLLASLWPFDRVQTIFLKTVSKKKVLLSQVADEVGPTLVDPELRRGDVLLMHGFTWHEAWPNNGQSDRCGLCTPFPSPPPPLPPNKRIREFTSPPTHPQPNGTGFVLVFLGQRILTTFYSEKVLTCKNQT
eukprot:COSAG04_NODE_2187_length_4587_cov_20.361773_4_plen_186_part_00